MERKITIAVACHKPYWKCENKLYRYIEAGAALHKKPVSGMAPDNTGENISDKNERFCELTVLYWMWKNMEGSYLGLCHFRRFFAEHVLGEKRARILTNQKLEQILRKTDVVLPRKRHYWIETNYSHYIHAHHKQDLDTVHSIITRICPEYLPAFERNMRQRSGHRFNMFIMRKDLFDAYCEWLFTILFKLENELDISEYDARSRRVFGFVAERLIDTWLDTNHISYRELPVVLLEPQNWITKGGKFLLRKMRGRK